LGGLILILTTCEDELFVFLLFWITFSMGIGILVGWAIWGRK
jgi:hypothetical protein